MNLEESNSFIEENEKNNKRKRSVLISIVICTILVILLLISIFTIQYQESLKLKMYIDGKEIGITSTMYRQVDEITYININEICDLLGYDSIKGEYNKYNEDEKSCYITTGYEIVSIKSDSSDFTKYTEVTAVDNMISEIPVTVKSENGKSEKFALNNPIKYIDNAIYVPFESLQDMLNMQIDLSQQNRIRLYTIEHIVTNAKNIISRLNYTTISGDYENLKAMVYNYAVVGDGTHYGVVSLSTGAEIIGLKYDEITFMPNTQDFLIKANGTVGILGSDGSTVIKPTEYDEISIYDDENQLYLVKKDSKYGILNRKGKVVVYPDYDAIGYERAQNQEFVEGTGNYKVLFNEAISVKEGTKFGLFDLEGNELLPSVYDGFGYVESSSTTTSGEKPVLLIPETLGIKGVVINLNDMYGVYDLEKREIIIPCVCSKIYSVTKSAKTTYYFVYNDQEENLDQYLELNNLKSIKPKEETIDSNENTENIIDNNVNATQE